MKASLHRALFCALRDSLFLSFFSLGLLRARVGVGVLPTARGTPEPSGFCQLAAISQHQLRAALGKPSFLVPARIRRVTIATQFASS